jgi:hypothetical protein
MEKLISGSAFFALPGQQLKVKSSRCALLLSLLLVASACDFINVGSSPSIPKDNPGRNADLPAGVAGVPTDNTHRMTSALRQSQQCYENASCDPANSNGYISYNYAGALLDSAEERESTISSPVVSFRQYHYDTNNRLDKVSVRETGNFHTLHDYYYDDEDDPSDFVSDDEFGDTAGDGYNANTGLTRPKLRIEYICEINLAAVTTEICDRLTAIEVINYIYYADGRLYRKEFDIDNDTNIDHQKVYYYSDGLLNRVDTDNFYNGIVDERFDYERDTYDGDGAGETLRVFVDNNRIQNRDINITVSYQLSDEGLVTKECYFSGELGSACTDSSTHSFHWIFNWEVNACWAGGHDDIDPEARAIDYLCKQGG